MQMPFGYYRALMTALSSRIPAALAAVFGIGLIAAEPLHAVTVEELAAKEPLTILTIAKGSPVDIGEGNQTNNLKDGGKVLNLSKRGLTSLAGISKLMVTEGDKSAPLKDLQGVQLFLNGNELEDLPEELATMDGITFLYVYDNKLRAIPPLVARMKGLLGMYFTGNKITEIPAF
ncbi:MAG: hypothetical protein JWO08_1986, partial [Verrucomicrobiaceae bacterium]|nr:hypothetical protein [Verrucomicrobiaceae bacterium]